MQPLPDWIMCHHACLHGPFPMHNRRPYYACRLLGRVEMTATAMLACMGVALSITGTASAVLRIINS